MKSSSLFFFIFFLTYYTIAKVMIIDNSESQVELFGDIKEFKTGIDPKNIEFITTLLSSNLYSDPERSFIREIVSNAWDSHVEAGTTDVPVLIKIGSNYVTIRDFGTGISPERFQDVYCNIGSSTKRESNDYIGGFGIGKFSALAVSNTVNIISYYEGKAYHYLMIKDGNKITNNLIMTLDTTEKNGVEVTVKNIKDIYKYYSALKYIIFFPNIYIDGELKKESDSINSTKIKYWKYFACASASIERNKILLGNVLYPLDDSLLNLSTEEDRFLSYIEHSGVVIRFNIGEIEVTPNRENIIYTEKTIKLIKERLSQAKDEIYEYIKEKTNLNFDNPFTWARTIISPSVFDFFKDSFYNYWNNGGMKIDLNLIKDKLLFQGNSYDSNCVNLIFDISGLTNPWFKLLNDGFKVYQKTTSIPYSYREAECLRYDKFLIIKDDKKLSRYVKEFLKEYYSGYVVINSFSYDNFLDFITEEFVGRFDKNIIDSYKDLLKKVYDFIMSKAITIDIDNNPKFISFKEELKKANIRVSSIQNFYLYMWENRSNYYNKIVHKRKLEFSNINDAIKYIRNIKRAIVLGNIDSDNEVKAELICPKNYLYITAAKPVLKELKEANIPNIISQEKALNNPEYIKLAYILKYRLGYNIGEDLLLETIPIEIKEDIKEANEVFKKYSGRTKLISYLSTLVLPEDTYYKGLRDKIEYYKERYYNVRLMYGLDNDDYFGYIKKAFIRDLTVALLIKNKAYRVNKESYLRLKNNLTFQKLWQKLQK